MQRENALHSLAVGDPANREGFVDPVTLSPDHDPWSAIFAEARGMREGDANDLFPFWIAPGQTAKIERHIPALPLSREQVQKQNLRKSMVLYRMVFGQSRQEDLIEYLLSRFPLDKAEQLVQLCRVDLTPPGI